MPEREVLIPRTMAGKLRTRPTSGRPMLIRTSQLKNARLSARDGVIGKVCDFLFDDEHWTVRYVEANTGNWLRGRRVLISPASLETPNIRAQELPVALTRPEIEGAPGIGEDQPVSRQDEAAHARHFGLRYYWIGGKPWARGGRPIDIVPDASESPASARAGDDQRLRSTAEVIGYTTHARDGDIGAVHDFILDTETWSIVFLALDTRKWLPGRRILLPIAWARRVAWTERKLTVDVTRSAIESAPEVAEPVTAEAAVEYLRHFGQVK